MEEFIKKIIDLISDIREVKRETNEEKVESIINEVRSDSNIKKDINGLRNSIEEKIRLIAQKKEEIIEDLEEKRSLLEVSKNMDDEEKNHMKMIINKEQEGLKKRIESVSQTLQNYEAKNFKDKEKNDSYLVLLENKNSWIREYENNKLELESLEINNIEQVINKIDEYISDVIDLNIKTVDDTRLLELVKEEKTEKDEKQNKYNISEETMEVSNDNIFDYEDEEIINKEIPNITEKTYNIKDNPKYYAVDYELETKTTSKNEEENVKENESESENKIFISAKENYAYLKDKNEKDKWNLEKIIKNSNSINRRMSQKAKQFGFEASDVRKIRRKANPVVSYILNYIENDEILKKYFLAVTMNTRVPFKIEHDLENSDLDKKTFRILNKYAKRDAQLPGVVVKGVKYNIFDRIKYRFNSNKTLTSGEKIKKDEEMMEELLIKRKQEKERVFRENQMVQNNAKTEKMDKPNRITHEDINKNTTRDNLMKQKIAREEEKIER